MKFRAFVINLKRSPERLVYMKNQLDKLGIDFSVQEAIDGNTYDFKNDYDEELDKKVHDGKKRTTGCLGCDLSHKRILEKVVVEDLDYALVFEDDVELSPDFKKIIDQEIQKRESNKTKWEYLSFNYPSVGWKSIALWLFLFYHMMKDNKKNIKYWFRLPIYFVKFFGFSIIAMLEGFREYIYKKIYRYGKATLFFRPLYLAGCYLVTKEGAKKMLEMNPKLTYSSDQVPNMARIKKGLKFYAFVPLVARQKRETFPSVINNKHFSKKVISY